MPTILLKKSDTPGSVPGTANLTNLAGGVEVAVNTADKRVYSMTSASAVIELGTNPSSLTCSDVSATVLRAGSATITNLLATTLTVSGGTANGVLYLNGSKVATSGTALTFDGTNGLGFGTGGTGNTAAVLTLKGSSATNYGAAITGTRNGSGSWFIGDAGTAIGSGTLGFIYYNYTTNDPWIWYDGGASAERMRLNSTGLGIGTSSPSYKLDVTVGSTSGAKLFRFSGASGQSLYGYADAGGTGITRTDPYNSMIYFNTSNGIELYTASTQRVVLDSSGNLGLGVSPSAWGSAVKAYQVGNSSLVGTSTQMLLSQNYFFDGADKYIATGPASQYYQVSGSHQWRIAASGTAGGAISFTQAMTLDASGNLGVGITLPNSRLDVVGGTGIRVNEDGASTKVIQVRSNFAGVGPAINVATNDPLLFQTNNTERGRFTAGGDFLTAGKTTASFTTVGAELLANGQINTATANIDNLNLYNTTAAAYRFYVSTGGTVFATNTTISAISDQRLKENVRDLDVGLDAIMALKPRKFDWKEGKGQDKKDVRGFIAQEFEQVFPDLIDEWKDPAPEGEEPYKSVRQDLIPVLVKAIQELSAKVAALEAK